MSNTIPKTKMCSPEIPNIGLVYSSGFLVSIGLRGAFLSLLFLVFLGFSKFQLKLCIADEVSPPSIANAYQMVTGDDSEDDRHRWDKLFDRAGYVFGKDPSPFLMEHAHFFHMGHVLDVAMGEGRNSVFLAEKGFSVDGVDISEVALRKAKRLARDNHVSIVTINADLTHYLIKPEYYQVILNFDYLQRSLIPRIKRGLKKGGIVVYENYTVDQLANLNGRYIRRDYLLKKGELKELFKDFNILVYRETNNGKDAKASLIARKP